VVLLEKKVAYSVIHNFPATSRLMRVNLKAYFKNYTRKGAERNG
jgi:hypothetical protein